MVESELTCSAVSTRPLLHLPCSLDHLGDEERDNRAEEDIHVPVHDHRVQVVGRASV